MKVRLEIHEVSVRTLSGAIILNDSEYIQFRTKGVVIHGKHTGRVALHAPGLRARLVYDLGRKKAGDAITRIHSAILGMEEDIPAILATSTIVLNK